MSEATGVVESPSLTGWFLRDATITVVFTTAMWGLNTWQLTNGFPAITVLCAALGFIAGYSLCYVYHEWGHLLGAKLSGGHMPLAPYSQGYLTSQMRGIPNGLGINHYKGT